MSRQPDRATSVTDEKIREEILKNLRKAFPGKPADRKAILHFNVTCKGKVIKLEGFVRGSNRFTKVLKAVKEIPSFATVKGLDIKGFSPTSKGKCDEETEQPCNGGCISKKQTCFPIG